MFFEVYSALVWHFCHLSGLMCFTCKSESQVQTFVVLSVPSPLQAGGDGSRSLFSIFSPLCFCSCCPSVTRPLGRRLVGKTGRPTPHHQPWSFSLQLWASCSCSPCSPLVSYYSRFNPDITSIQSLVELKVDWSVFLKALTDYFSIEAANIWCQL